MHGGACVSAGAFSPRLYFNADEASRVWVHGDDFAALLPRSRATTFSVGLGRFLIVKVRATLGFRAGDDHSIRILNRLIELVPSSGAEPDTIFWESDPRHVPLLAAQFGLRPGSKPVAAPGLKAQRAVLEGPDLEPAKVPAFRSACMRAAFVAQDRPEVMFCSKEIARTMSKPTRAAWESLKHLIRFMMGQPRLRWVFKRQAVVGILRANTDSDYAGCFTTRRSTSGTMLFHGQHLIKARATTQTVVALSVGESEYNSVVKGAASILGLQ